MFSGFFLASGWFLNSLAHGPIPPSSKLTVARLSPSHSAISLTLTPSASHFHFSGVLRDRLKLNILCDPRLEITDYYFCGILLTKQNSRKVRAETLEPLVEASYHTSIFCCYYKWDFLKIIF